MKEKGPHCSIMGCNREAKSRGMCDAHLTRFYRGKRNKDLVIPFRDRQTAVIEPGSDKQECPFHEILFQLLHKSKRAWTAESLSDKFNVGVGKIRDAIRRLEDQGQNIRLGKKVDIPESMPTTEETSTIDVSKFHGSKISFGLTADNHLGSRYERMDVLNALYNIWAEQGIKVVYQAGNMIDGFSPRINLHDLKCQPGVDSQAEYLAEHWPRRNDIVTKFVTGHDHEGWYVRTEGVNIPRYLQIVCRDHGRDDMEFLGHMEHDIRLKGKRGSSWMRIIHAGGGSAYATSYSVQKIIESLQGGEKPAILLVGHYHKAEFSYPREVSVIQAGSTQDQTPWMRQRRLQSMIGGWTISFEIDDHGIVHGFTPQWHGFFDRGFYTGKNWRYRWN